MGTIDNKKKYITKLKDNKRKNPRNNKRLRKNITNIIKEQYNGDPNGLNLLCKMDRRQRERDV